MVIINLLPWRAGQEQYERGVIRKLLLGSLVFVGIVLLLARVLLGCWQEHVRTKVQRSQAKIQALASVQIRMREHEYRSIATSINQKVTVYRDNTRHLFAAMGAIDDERLCFTEFVRANNKITFMGNARSGADLTEFLKHWSAAALFSEIRIEQLRQENQQVKFRFQADELTPLSNEPLLKKVVR